MSIGGPKAHVTLGRMTDSFLISTPMIIGRDTEFLNCVQGYSQTHEGLASLVDVLLASMPS
jgi:hypothetical protein